MHVCMHEVWTYSWQYLGNKQNVWRNFRKEFFDASIIKENSNIIPDLMNILT